MLRVYIRATRQVNKCYEKCCFLLDCYCYLNVSGHVAYPSRGPHSMFRQFQPKIAIFRPSRSKFCMFQPCSTEINVLKRAQPKQDMFRPCSTKQFALSRARPKQDIF